MFKKNKKGFTLLEIVVVIAVIAVLAAVLIPTFAKMLQRANESSDVQTVRSMNSIIAHKSLDTVEDVKDLLEDNGISRNSTSSVAGRYFVWDKTTNTILVATNEGSNAKALYPESHEGKSSVNEEWYRLTEEVIEVSASELADYTLTAFMPTLKISENVNNDVVIEGLANIDLNGYTITGNFTMNSGNKGSIYLKNGKITGEEFNIMTPLATINQLANFTVSVKNANVTVAEHSYHLDGAMICNVLNLKGNSHFVINETSAFVPSKLVIEEDLQPTISVVKNNAEETIILENLEKTTFTGKEISEKIEESFADIITGVKTIEVSNETELINAINNGGEIDLTTNITVSTRIKPQKSFTLNGNGYTISGSDERVFNFDGEDYPSLNNGTYIFNDVSIVNTSEAPYTRSVSLYGVNGASFVFNKVNLTAGYYALNLAMNNTNLNIVVKNNSVITGWAAINSYAVKSNITVVNSKLVGFKANSGDEFGVVVLDGAAIAPEKTYENSVSCIFTFSNVEFVSRSAFVNDNFCLQLLISIQYSQPNSLLNNKIDLNGCSFKLEYYIDGETYNAVTNDVYKLINNTSNENNFVYVNGELIETDAYTSFEMEGNNIKVYQD